MADSTTQRRTRTEVVRDGDGPAETTDPGSSSTPGVLSMLAGGAGVVVAIPPGLGIVALGLAAMAIGTGVPVMRRGPGTPGFSSARTGVVLGMIAVLLGFVSLGMQVLG